MSGLKSELQREKENVPAIRRGLVYPLHCQEECGQHKSQ